MTQGVLYCLAAIFPKLHHVLCCGKVSTDDSLGRVQMYIRTYVRSCPQSLVNTESGFPNVLTILCSAVID